MVSLVVLTRKLCLFNYNGISCLIRIFYPQGLLPRESRKPVQSKCLGTRLLYIWNWWFPRPYLRMLVYCQLIRPSSCHPGERPFRPVWPPGVLERFSFRVFSLFNVLSQQRFGVSGTFFWKAFVWFTILQIICEFTRSPSSFNGVML